MSIARQLGKEAAAVKQAQEPNYGTYEPGSLGAGLGVNQTPVTDAMRSPERTEWENPDKPGQRTGIFLGGQGGAPAESDPFGGGDLAMHETSPGVWELTPESLKLHQANLAAERNAVNTVPDISPQQDFYGRMPGSGEMQFNRTQDIAPDFYGYGQVPADLQREATGQIPLSSRRVMNLRSDNWQVNPTPMRRPTSNIPLSSQRAANLAQDATWQRPIGAQAPSLAQRVGRFAGAAGRAAGGFAGQLGKGLLSASRPTPNTAFPSTPKEIRGMGKLYEMYPETKPKGLADFAKPITNPTGTGGFSMGARR